MIRAFVALIILATLSCAPNLYAGKGTAYFITGLVQPAQDYDVLVADAQRNWTTHPPFDAGQIYLAYYNTMGIPEIDGNALYAQLHQVMSPYFLMDGSDPVVYDDGQGWTQMMLKFDDIEMAYAHADYIERHQNHWPGSYLDNAFVDEEVPQWYLDSLTTYTADSEATIKTDFGLYRDALIDRLRQITPNRYLIVANCGYPPLWDDNLSGITVESGHVTTAAKRDSVNSMFRRYIFPGSGFHNVAWEWYDVSDSSFWAHDGELSYTP